MSLTNLDEDGVVSDGSSCSVDQYCSGEQNVRAEMLANPAGNFVFDTNDRARIDDERRLVLQFSQPVPSTLTDFSIDAFIGTIGVTGTATDGNLRTMAAGEILQRRTRIGWVEGNLQFSLRWDGLTEGPNGDPERSFVSFECTAVDGLECKQWTASPPGKAGLYSIPTKGSTMETYYGTYSMPFSMTLVRQ